MRVLIFMVLALPLVACVTKGELQYITAEGERKTACQTEYSGAPSVDKFAVEYILSYCAKKAAERGNVILDQTLLSIDLTIPFAPNGKPWTFEYATALHRAGKLTDKEYGYIIAYIDLGLNGAPST